MTPEPNNVHHAIQAASASLPMDVSRGKHDLQTRFGGFVRDPKRPAA